MLFYVEFGGGGFNVDNHCSPLRRFYIPIPSKCDHGISSLGVPGSEILTFSKRFLGYQYFMKISGVAAVLQ
jgi:hypothetical protein